MAIGRSGIAEKVREGDGVTPIGRFSITSIGYRIERVAFVTSNIQKYPVGLNDLWSDDPKDKNYNHKVYSYNYLYSHENLRRSENNKRSCI